MFYIYTKINTNAKKQFGGSMKGGMQDMLRQVQKLQDEMQKTQAGLANKTVTAEAGGGIIKAVASEIRKLSRLRSINRS